MTSEESRARRGDGRGLIAVVGCYITERAIYSRIDAIIWSWQCWLGMQPVQVTSLKRMYLSLLARTRC